MHNYLLKQARSGFTQNIKNNQITITVRRRPTATDPITGETVIDPEGTETTHNIKCRITHEKAQVPRDEQSPAGLSTNLQRMIMADWKNELTEGDIFTVEFGTYEIGEVDPIYMFNGIIGYQATLKEA